MTKVNSFDVNSDSSVVLLTGKTDKQNLLIATSFDSYFDCVSVLEFDCEVFAIRKIHSSDYFMVGGKNIIFIVQLTSKGSLVEVTSVKDLQIGLIQQIEVDSQAAYLLEKDGGKMCTITFSKYLEKLL